MPRLFRGPEKQRATVDIYIPEEDLWVLGKVEELRRRDLWSISRVWIEAIKEYTHRHLPGNPQPPMDHWLPGGPPFSEAATERLRVQELPPKTQLHKCEKCNGEGCEKCGFNGFYYHLHL